MLDYVPMVLYVVFILGFIGAGFDKETAVTPQAGKIYKRQEYPFHPQFLLYVNPIAKIIDLV